MRASIFILLMLVAGAIEAQAQLPDNIAEEVRQSYRFSRSVPAFRFLGDFPNPDPQVGVTLEWLPEATSDLRVNIFLYRAEQARLPAVALREGAARYLAEVRHFAPDLRLPEPSPYKLRAGSREIEGFEHAFGWRSESGRMRSYTLLFYQHGHFIKLRATGRISAGKLRRLGRQLMAGFMPGFAVLSPYGHRCGPPDIVTVAADDPRAGQFGEHGYEFYLPAGLAEAERVEHVAAAMTASLLESASADCFGDGVRLEIDHRAGGPAR